MKLAILIAISLICLTNAFYSGNSKVQQLNMKNFKQKVLDSDEPWFIEFYAPWCGHCKGLAPEYDKLAKALDGIINVGAVDADTEKQLGAQFQVQGFPTLKFFGHNKQKPIDYQGQRQASAMVDFAFEQAKKMATKRLSGKGSASSGSSSSKKEQKKEQKQEPAGNEADVVVLTDANFQELVLESDDMWMIKFYAPWCGHCKQLAPVWTQLATKLKGKVKIGKVDATVEKNIAQQYSVSGYPTLKMFPPGKKSYSSAQPYEGGRDLDSLYKFATDKIKELKPAFFEQLVNEELFQKNCKEEKGVCLLGFVPHIYDSSADQRNDYLEMLKKSAEKFKSSPVTFFWTQGGDHYELEEALNLGTGYPALIALSFAKSKYATLKGHFTSDTIEDFTAKILSGREPFLSFDESRISKLRKVEKWDGKDKKPESNDYDDEL